VTDPRQPHDALFKATFSHPARAAAELRAILPAALSRQIDFSTLTLMPGSFVDRRLRGTHSDLLFRARISGQHALLYLLFEHQSEPDEIMALRMLGYVVHILERHVAETPRGSAALPLPAVIPIVLHHGAAGWMAASTMTELFDQRLVADATLLPYLPQFSFVLDDLRNVTDDQIAARELGDFASLALWALRDARGRERLLRSLDYWAATLDRMAADNAAALQLILRYLLAVVPDVELDEVLHRLETRAPAAEKFMATMGEKLEARGRAEGEARGRAEGEARGRAEGLRRVLVHQLTLKFGKVDDAARTAIDQADETKLLVFSERVLSASSVSAVLEG
jgi:predicted transposase/invertase (TIGR01784 family)